MSSFFKKGKPRTAGKRKFKDNKDKKDSNSKQNNFFLNGKKSKPEDDDEIDSDEFDDEVLQHKKSRIIDDGDDIQQNEETAQEKRLRLAKTYLEAIEIEEKNRSENADIDESITKRLNQDYLESIGKLRVKIADNLIEFEDDKILTFKHKQQKLPITCICISSDDKFLFTGSKSGYIVKWDLSLSPPKAIGNFDLKEIIKKDGGNKQGYPTSLAISTDFRFLAISNLTKSIYITCPETLKFLHRFEGHRDYVTGVVIRKDTHSLYSSSADRSVKTWSLDEMTYCETLFGHQFPVTSIDALSRERVITSGGSDHSVRIWKIAEESQLLFRGHNGNIELVKYVNDDNFVSAADDGSLCSWSSLRKKPLCTIELAHGKGENGDPNWITAIATLMNTDIFASGSSDGFIRLWKLGDNCRSITQIFQIPITGFINSLTFTSDAENLIAGIGQEHRLGRWWRLTNAKNCNVIIPLKKIE